MKRNSRRRNVNKRERVQAAPELMHLGFRDYIGARVLLREGLCLQGATLASTAVEKYLKAIAAMRGNVIPGHLKRSHVDSLRNYVPELFGALNPEFLSLLERCCKLRYTDGLPPRFNIKVFAREVLAELDYTIHRIEQQVNAYREPSRERVLTAYRKALADGAERLCTDNHVVAKQSKSAFLTAEPSAAYLLRASRVSFSTRCSPRVSPFFPSSQHVWAPRSPSRGGFARGSSPLLGLHI